MVAGTFGEPWEYDGNQWKMVGGATGALPKTTKTTNTSKNNRNHQNHKKPTNLMEIKGNGKYPREAVGDLMGLKGKLEGVPQGSLCVSLFV